MLHLKHGQEGLVSSTHDGYRPKLSRHERNEDDVKGGSLEPDRRRTGRTSERLVVKPINLYASLDLHTSVPRSKMLHIALVFSGGRYASFYTPAPTPPGLKAWTRRYSPGTWVNFFSDKIDRIREIIKTSLQLSTSNFAVSPPFRTQTTLTHLSPVTAAEVKQLIQSAPAKTSPTDVIPTSFLKVFSEELSLMIAHVANVSFAAARFPSSMKLGRSRPY